MNCQDSLNLPIKMKLEYPDLPLAELIQLIAESEKSTGLSRKVGFGISANITVDLLATFIKKHSILHNFQAEVNTGSYNSHFENIREFLDAGIEQLILINFFDNIMPSLESGISQMDPALLEEQKKRFQAELQLVLDSAKSFKLIHLFLCHRFLRPESAGIHSEIDSTIQEFNQIIRNEGVKHKNVRLINPAEAVAFTGWHRAFNSRFYYNFKAPYTAQLCDELARQISLISRGSGSYFFKALILDCDNTLWGGTIGEDLLDGIKLHPENYPGNIYQYAQKEFVNLQKNGVLLCLCSKNNADDVDEVLEKHRYQIIRDQHLILKKVNWETKAKNILEISQELNIGLDSFVFLDDSSHECDIVRTQLPTVKVFQVPKNIFEYPEIIHHIKELFLSSTTRDESVDKTAQYRQRALAINEQEMFGSQEDYLKSLKIKVEIRKNAKANVGRISELTQKSNQFNLTTHRYSESEIQALMESKNTAVYSLYVSDKFGDSGLTGVIISKFIGKNFILDTFLMSCRVIGRGIEFAFWNKIIDDAKEAGCSTMVGQYIQSSKNAQVKNFLKELGLSEISNDDGVTNYASNIQSLVIPPPKHLEIIYVI